MEGKSAGQILYEFIARFKVSTRKELYGVISKYDIERDYEKVAKIILNHNIDKEFLYNISVIMETSDDIENSLIGEMKAVIKKRSQAKYEENPLMTYHYSRMLYHLSNLVHVVDLSLYGKDRDEYKIL